MNKVEIYNRKTNKLIMANYFTTAEQCHDYFNEVKDMFVKKNTRIVITHEYSEKKECEYSEKMTETAEITYEVPATPAVEYQPAVYEQIPAKTYQIPIGTSVVGEDVEIPNGTYDITCSSGSGNVVARGVKGDLKLNEIMATYSDDLFLDEYNNYKLKQGDSFETDCNLVLTGENTEKLVTPEIKAVPATEAYNKTEKVKLVNGETETCYIDNEESPCSNLKYYDQLRGEAK